MPKNEEVVRFSKFVSHSWDKPFGAFVHSLKEDYCNKFTKPILWICAFSLLQGTVEEIKTQLGVGETSLDKSPFVMVLESTTTYLVVRNSNTDLYSRIWCICEVISARKVCFILHKTIISGPSFFSDIFTSYIDAESYSNIDKTWILKELVNNHSTAKIDKYIREFCTVSVSGSMLSKKPSKEAELPHSSRDGNMTTTE